MGLPAVRGGADGFVISALVLLGVLACGTLPPRPEPDAGATCEQAEQRIAQLCPDYEPSPGPDGVLGTGDDRSFADECKLLEEDFPGLAQPSCIVEAADCESARACAGE